MIGKLLSSIKKICNAENAEATVDGKKFIVRGSLGDAAYTVTFSQISEGSLPARSITKITIQADRGGESITTQLPLISRWWRLRVAFFVRRQLQKIIIERARVALGN